MKYYVEPLKKFFDTLEEAEAAEKKHEEEIKAKEEEKIKLAAERKTRAKEVDDAAKNAYEAKKKYLELRNKFVKDYGSYYITIKDDDIKNNIGDFFKDFHFFDW